MAAEPLTEPSTTESHTVSLVSTKGKSLFKSKAAFNIALHLYNHGGQPLPKPEDGAAPSSPPPQGQHYHIKELVNETTGLMKCVVCGGNIEVSEICYVNYTLGIAWLWEEGKEHTCEGCMAQRLRTTLGNDDDAIMRAHEALHHKCVVM